MSEMKKKMENVMAENRMTSFEDHHVKDTIINMVKLIKQENWDKIMKNNDGLFEWLDLNSNLRVVFENVKNDFVAKRQIFTNSLKDLSDQVLNKVKRSSDRDLANHGIKNRLDACVMAINVSQHCEEVTRIGESLNSASKELMKMNNTIVNLLNVGLPNPANSEGTFIGNENYMKKLQGRMNSDLGKLPEEFTPEGIASCIKPLSTMSDVIDRFLLSYDSISQKYFLLTRLQLISYNLKKMGLPNDAEWSALKKFSEAGSSSQIVIVAISGSHS